MKLIGHIQEQEGLGFNKIKILLITVIFFTKCWGQETQKDSLFLSYKSEYICLKINYENYHHFIFKKEKFVTSAFGENLIDEELNHFVQSNNSSIFKGLNPKKIYDIKEYLNSHKSELFDDVFKKYDSYKLMLLFDKFHVFFKHNGYFIEVKYHTPLAE